MILFIPPLGFVFHSFRLECHPKERILLLFLLISFPNSPKRMHPRIKDKSREEMSFRSKLTTTGVEGYIYVDHVTRYSRRGGARGILSQNKTSWCEKFWGENVRCPSCFYLRLEELTLNGGFCFRKVVHFACCKKECWNSRRWNANCVDDRTCWWSRGCKHNSRG